METFAEGLATRVAFELPQQIMREHLDDFVLVCDDEIRSAMVALIETTRNLVEAAGAASLAGALRLRERLAGKRVALICSGGNVSCAPARRRARARSALAISIRVGHPRNSGCVMRVLPRCGKGGAAAGLRHALLPPSPPT